MNLDKKIIRDYILGSNDLSDEDRSKIEAEILKESSNPDSIVWEVAREITEKTKLAFDSEDTHFGVGMPSELEKEETTHSDSPEQLIRTSSSKGIYFKKRFWMYGSVITALFAFLFISWFFNQQKPTTSSTFVDTKWQISIDPNGNVHGLSYLPEDLQTSAVTLLRKKVTTIPAFVAGLQTGARGGDLPTAYIQPVGTIIRSTTPKFLWHSYGEGFKYQVLIYLKDQTKATLKSDVLSVSHWSIPQKDSLKRGIDYQWEIVVFHDGNEDVPDEPRPKFQVLSESKLAEITKELKTVPNSHLARYLIYINSGLLDEAQQEMESLESENPDSPIIHKLLHNLKIQR